MAQKAKKTRTQESPGAKENQEIIYISELCWQEGENLRSQVKAPEPSEDTNHPDVGLDGAEGKSLKTRTSGGPRARESLGFPFAPARPPQRFWVPRGPPNASQSRKTRFS